MNQKARLIFVYTCIVGFLVTLSGCVVIAD